MKPSPKIVVVGSINMDLVIQCKSLPLPGETVLANEAQEVCGGKGANQAVAAARAGGDVAIIGRVGDDAFADRLLANLRRQQVDFEAVEVSEATASGLAVVAVEASSQNSIIVVPGANGSVTPDNVQRYATLIESADLVMLQLEIPLETVLAVQEIAKAAGVPVMLDPAPVPESFPNELLRVDLICPNESEAATLTGLPTESLEEIKFAAEALHRGGASKVVITLGDRGCLFFDGDHFLLSEACRITPVDTTAAGDGFAGALAVAWAESGDLERAIGFANVAGGLAASRWGAQPSLPSRQEIESFRNSS